MELNLIELEKITDDGILLLGAMKSLKKIHLNDHNAELVSASHIHNLRKLLPAAKINV